MFYVLCFFKKIILLFSFNSELKKMKKKNHMQNGVILVGLTVAITDL